MTQGRTEHSVRALLAVALLLSFGLFGGTCTSNAGRVFSGNTGNGGGGNGGGGGGGGEPPLEPAPAQSVFAGALVLDGAPLAQAFGPANAATGVDVQSPIAIWFSESLARSSVNISSIGVRRTNGAGGVNREVSFFQGDRCVVLTPSSPLLTSTEYEIFATQELHDLSGTRFVPPSDGVLATFTTAAASDGLDPQVVAAFPPHSATGIPHDSDVLVVFSKPVSYQSAIANIRVEQIDAGGAVLGAAAVDAPIASQNGGRVFPYLRTDGAGALDLGARLQTTVDAGVEDTEFNVNTLDTPVASSWQTLSFGAPQSLSTAAMAGGEDQDLSLALLGAYPLRMDVSGIGLNAGDTVQATVGEAIASFPTLGVAQSSQSAVLTAAQVGGAELVFSFDLVADPNFPFVSQLADGSMAINAFAERNGQRTLVAALTGLVQDTVPPTLTRFGPPFASSAGNFVTDLPELRPYGFSNEAIGSAQVQLDGQLPAVQTAAAPSEDSWFLAASAPGLTDAQRFDSDVTEFDLLLVDAAGNPMASSVTGRARFRGFVGDTAATDDMTVQVFDARSLSPVFGCSIQIEAADGSDFRAAQTALAGELDFSGLAGRAYHVTVQAEGYHAATFYGLQSTLVSLPLRPQTGASQAITPVVTLANANGGEVRFASPLLVDEDELPIPQAQEDASLPFGFEFAGLDVRGDRPGWFGGFFRLSDTDPFTQFAVEERVVVDPFSLSTVSAAPALDMIEFSAAPRADYPLDWPLVPGNEGMRTGAVVAIPGLTGLAPVGIGDDFGDGTNATTTTVTVPDALRQAAADYSGQVFADQEIDLMAQALFGQGAYVLSRVRDASVAGPNTINWPSDVPTVQAAGVDPRALAGTPLAFRDSLTLDGDAGYYRIVIDDGIEQWDLWVSASERAAGNPPFPTLDESPLDDNIDAVWTMFVEAFHMAPGFSESGFFFSILERDWDLRTRAAERTITS